MQSSRWAGASYAQALILFVLALFGGPAFGQLSLKNHYPGAGPRAVQDFPQYQDIYEAGKVPVHESNNDFSSVGDSVDLYSGRLSIRQTDLVVPGIGPEIRVERIWQGTNADEGENNLTAEFGDWALNIPRIEGIVGVPSSTPVWPTNRCSSFDQIDFTTNLYATSFPTPGPLINQGFTLEYGGKARSLVRAAAGIFP